MSYRLGSWPLKSAPKLLRLQKSNPETDSEKLKHPPETMTDVTPFRTLTILVLYVETSVLSSCVNEK